MNGTLQSSSRIQKTYNKSEEKHRVRIRSLEHESELSMSLQRHVAERQPILRGRSPVLYQSNGRLTQFQNGNCGHRSETVKSDQAARITNLSNSSYLLCRFHRIRQARFLPRFDANGGVKVGGLRRISPRSDAEFGNGFHQHSTESDTVQVGLLRSVCKGTQTVRMIAKRMAARRDRTRQRRVCNEKRNVDQCSPARRKPHRRC